MSDMFSGNRMLFIKRHMRDKLSAEVQVQSREIRILELEEEIERNRGDIVAQEKIIAECEKNIALQKEEMDKSPSITTGQ